MRRGGGRRDKTGHEERVDKKLERRELWNEAKPHPPIREAHQGKLYALVVLEMVNM